MVQFADNPIQPLSSCNDFAPHSVGVYSNSDEVLSLVGAYIKNARSRNRRLSLFGVGSQHDDIMHTLSAAGYPADQAIWEGWAEFSRAEDVYFHDGEFSPGALRAGIESSVQKALADGYEGISTIGWMEWRHALIDWDCGEPRVSDVTLAKYEYGLHELQKTLPALQAFCMYSSEHFADTEIALQCLCHGSVLFQNCRIDNAFHSLIDPESAATFDLSNARGFLRELESRGYPVSRLRGSSADFLRELFIEWQQQVVDAQPVGSSVLNPDVMATMNWMDFWIERLEFNAKR